MGQVSLALVGGVICLVLYLLKLNWVLSHTPQDVVDRAGEPLTPEYVKDVFERVKKDGLDWKGKLPPRKDRRYIVVGGSGFLGGQIILHLLAMGTPPEAIRILDARRPFTFRKEFSQGAPSKVAYIQTDITNEAATLKSYNAPWPEAVAGLPLTVFHTAAVIRPFDRYKMLYERTSRVNITGAVHSLEAAKKAGAGVFIYTSSSNAALKQVKWLFAPWGATQQPEGFLQNLSNEDFFEPQRQPHEFPSNYAQSKAKAERLICGANEAAVLRTGVIRPGNPVYGHKDDNIAGRMLALGGFPSWVAANVQNWISVKNASLAHLQYEDALLGEHGEGIAGRPFIVTDKGKPVRFQDIYTLLDSVSTTGMKVSYPPPLLILMLSYLVEWYALLLNAVPLLGRFLSELGEDVKWIQPGVHATSLHYFIDDSEAKKTPADGGFGYSPCCTTVEGLCSQVVDWNLWVEEEKLKK
ncbi:hypothetical protein ACQKWADRAFT_276946 [Trichoderma austrokoningii]